MDIGDRIRSFRFRRRPILGGVINQYGWGRAETQVKTSDPGLEPTGWSRLTQQPSAVPARRPSRPGHGISRQAPLDCLPNCRFLAGRTLDLRSMGREYPVSVWGREGARFGKFVRMHGRSCLHSSADTPHCRRRLVLRFTASEPADRTWGVRFIESGVQVNLAAVRVGKACAPIHHGEIVQGAFRVGGRVMRGLVTLPCPLYRSRATFARDLSGQVRVLPRWREKARRAAELAVVEIEPGSGGCLEIDSDVPLCRGLGSSTSDVLAAIWAAADSFGLVLPPADVARLAVEAETASDSLMFNHTAVLFAHREGTVIEDFGACLPPLHMLGFGTGGTVNTLAYQPVRYTERELDVFGELRVMLRHAIATKDCALIGKVATTSTWINQKHLPIPHLDEVCGVAADVGAIGVQTAHSGDVGGILFERHVPDLGYRVEIAQKLLRRVGHNDHWRFDSGA
jgi:uncharacterized protein involved in propanediol utilization